MALLYRGYAQEKGFNPIQVPDPSKKIREQGLQAMKAQADIIQWNKSEAVRIAKALDSNTDLLLDSRKEFWKQRSAFRDTVEEARKVKQTRILENHQRRAKNEEQAWKDLVNITESGAKLVKMYDAHSKEQASLWAKQLYEDTGLTSKEFNSLRSVQDHIWNKDKTQVEIYQQLRERGVEEDKIEQIRRMGGYREVAVQKLTAVNLMRRRGSFYQQNRNTKINVLGQETTLGTILASGDGTQLDEAIRQLDLKAIQEHGEGYPSTRILHSSGALKVKEEIVSSLHGTLQTNTTNRIKKRQHDEPLDILESMLTDTPEFLGDQAKYQTEGEAVQDWLTRGLPANATREQLVSTTERNVAALIFGIKSGRISPETARKLLNSDFTPRGSTKTVKWGGHLKRHATLIETAIADRDKHDLGVQESLATGYKIEAKKMLLDAVKIYEESDPDLETQVALLHRFNENPYAKDAQTFVSSRLSNHRNTLNDATALAYIKGRISKNHYITEDEIGLLKTSTEGRARIRELVNASNPFLPRSEQLDSIKEFAETELRKIIPKSATWGVQSTRSEAEKAAVNIAVDAYREARKSGKDIDASLAYAKGVVKDELHHKDSKFQPSLPTAETNGIVEFSGFVVPRIPGSERIIVDTPNIERTFTDNPDAIYTQPYMSINDLVKKSQAINKGLSAEMIPQSSLLSNLHPTLTPIEVEQAQLEYYRNREIEEHGSSTIQLYPEDYINEIKGLEEPIHPLARPYLSSRQAVNKAVITHPDPSNRTALIYNDHLLERSAKLIAKGDGITEQDQLMLSSCKNMIDGNLETKNGYREPCLLSDLAFSILYQEGYYATV